MYPVWLLDLAWLPVMFGVALALACVVVPSALKRLFEVEEEE